MSSLIQIFNIFTLQNNVKDLHYSNAVAAGLFFLLVILDSLVFNKISSEYSSPTIYAIVLNGLQAGGIFLALKIHHKEQRFTQLWIAILGVSCIVNSLFLAIPLSAETMLFLFLLQVWMIYLLIRFYRETLECTWLRSMATCLLVALSTIFLFSTIFPGYADEDLVAKENLINLLTEQ